MIPGYGQLVYDHVKHSMGAQCTLNGCRINKVRAKRPIGYIVAWLLLSRDRNHARTPTLHKGLKLQQADGQPLSRQERAHAWEWALNQPALRPVFALEPGNPHDEPPTCL